MASSRRFTVFTREFLTGGFYLTAVPQAANFVRVFATAGGGGGAGGGATNGGGGGGSGASCWDLRFPTPRGSDLVIIPGAAGTGGFAGGNGSNGGATTINLVNGGNSGTLINLPGGQGGRTSGVGGQGAFGSVGGGGALGINSDITAGKVWPWDMNHFPSVMAVGGGAGGDAATNVAGDGGRGYTMYSAGVYVADRIVLNGRRICGLGAGNSAVGAFGGGGGGNHFAVGGNGGAVGVDGSVPLTAAYSPGPSVAISDDANAGGGGGGGGGTARGANGGQGVVLLIFEE
jgi:hypothetical protein